jgi:DUF4097 and DUF4098 domain-containing protein YvlB
MKHHAGLTSAALLAAAFSIAPAEAQSKHYNLSVESSANVDSCADLKVKSTGAISQTSEKFTLQGASVELDGGSRGGIRVRGADRADYSVEACKLAAAGDSATAAQMVSGISVNHSAWRVETHGPSVAEGDGDWQVLLIVHAPRNGSVDLTTVNGPIDVRDVAGAVKVKATNGPLSIQNCNGTVDAQTTNGPISFSGSAGDVKLSAANGPLSVKLSGDVWNGPRFEASTKNGPVSLMAPNTFRSALRVDSNGSAPFSCKAEICRNAITDARSERRSLQINGSADTVRISTGNGPVSVQSSTGK